MYFVAWYPRLIEGCAMRWDFFGSGHCKDKTFLKFVYGIIVFASFIEICSYSFDEVLVSLLLEFAFN